MYNSYLKCQVLDQIIALSIDYPNKKQKCFTIFSDNLLSGTNKVCKIFPWRLGLKTTKIIGEGLDHCLWNQAGTLMLAMTLNKQNGIYTTIIFWVICDLSVFTCIHGKQNSNTSISVKISVDGKQNTRKK